MHNRTRVLLIGLAVVAGCATYVAPSKEESMQAVKSSFKERSIAKLDRLNQTEIQAVCSDAQMAGKEVPKTEREALEKKVLATVKYPADGKYLGDYKQGERISGATTRRRSTAATAMRATRSLRRRSPTATSVRRCSATASCAGTTRRWSSTPGARSGTLTLTTCVRKCRAMAMPAS